MLKKIKLLSLILLSMLIYSHSLLEAAKQEDLIQMAILLDTSSSMNGLIEQAKAHLWKVVNEFAEAKKNGKTPKLEVAIYEYGKSSIPSSEGYIRMITPLTTDLDLISQELFKLSTNGGDEYCGHVIKAATQGLKWSTSNKDLKVIFIAGNEPFTQGAVDYVKSCKDAIKRGIIVNTIHCGNYEEGIRTKWQHGAILTDGQYLNIDHNQRIAHVSAPQDKEIIRLGTELNKTYIGYGRLGEKKKECQSRQDMNASGMNKGVAVERSVSKASGHYRNSSWDLVDAVKNGDVDLEKIEDEEIPGEMKKMTVKERKAYVLRMQKKRAAIQSKINKLNKDRQRYIAEETKKRSGSNTLGTAMVESLRKQAVKRNFNFK